MKGDPATLLASSRESEWRKGASAVLARGGGRAAFIPWLRPEAIVDATAVRRATVIVEAMHAALEAPEGASMLVPPLLGPLRARRDKAAWAEHGPKLVETIICFLARRTWEILAQYVIDFDVDEETLTALYSRMPDKRAASAAVRAQSVMRDATKESKARAKIAHQAIGRTPRPVSTLRFRSGPGTEGGPLLLADSGSLTDWHGTDTDDYERACDDPRTAFVRKVFLSINHTGCSYVLLPHGCLVVMEGTDDAFPDKKGFRRIGTLALPSGKLVVFDATGAKGKTREKRVIVLPKGRYLVEELYRNQPWLWMVRFTRR